MSNTPALANSSDNTSLEWLLKTNLGDDHASVKPFHQQQHHQYHSSGTTMGNYLAAAPDDPYETQLSPSSSDMSVVEILPASLAFAEF